MSRCAKSNVFYKQCIVYKTLAKDVRVIYNIFVKIYSALAIDDNTALDKRPPAVCDTSATPDNWTNMFGYLDIQKDLLDDGQQGLWQTFMCGLCLSAKRQTGNVSRMFVNNDINTFNVLFHSVLGLDVDIFSARCIAHPFKKRSLLVTDEITDKLAVANVILTRWNLYDDVVDGGKAKKRVALSAINPSYRKARKLWQKLDDEIAADYAALRTDEQHNCTSIDRTAHHFAVLSEHFCTLTLGERANEYITTLCYNLGKWIYLADALDDVAKDIAKGNFNPFVNCYNAATVQDVAEHVDEIKFVMYTTLNRVAQCYNDLNPVKYRCVLDNIFYHSIRNKTARLLDNLAKHKIADKA